MDTDQQEAVGKAMSASRFTEAAQRQEAYQGKPHATSISSIPALAPPSPDTLAILRLYLEHYPTLAEEDRRLYRGLILQIANPSMVVRAGEGLGWMRGEPRVSQADDTPGLTELLRRKAGQ